MTAYLDLADYLLIAEAVLRLPAWMVARFDRIGLASSALAAPQAGFGGVEAYPDMPTKAAVLCWHLVKNHPLPDGNKRCAFLATIEFVERNGGTWRPAPGDPDETDQVIRAVAASDMSQADLRGWIAERISWHDPRAVADGQPPPRRVSEAAASGSAIGYARSTQRRRPQGGLFASGAAIARQMDERLEGFGEW